MVSPAGTAAVPELAVPCGCSYSQQTVTAEPVQNTTPALTLGEGNKPQISQLTLNQALLQPSQLELQVLEKRGDAEI